MYSNASQKVTFRSVKRHLLPALTFPPAESGADTALQRGRLRPAEGRKTIYTPAAPPPPPGRPASGTPPPAPPQGALPALPPLRDRRALRGAYARHHARPALRRRARGRRKGTPSREQGRRSCARKGEGGIAHNPLSDGRRRGKKGGKKGKGGVGAQRKEQQPSRQLLHTFNMIKFFLTV